MVESILTENLEVLELEEEIRELNRNLLQINPALVEARECLNCLSNRHAELMQLNRDKQKELRLLMNNYQKCSPHKAVKKRLEHKEPMSRGAIKKLLASMPADMKAKLMEGLLRD